MSLGTLECDSPASLCHSESSAVASLKALRNQLTVQNSVTELLGRVPSFVNARSSDASFMSHDDDSPYLVFGDLGIYLLEGLKNRQSDLVDEITLRQAFELLSEMLTSNDPELINLAQVGVLEVLADSSVALDIATSYLSEDANRMLNDSRG